MAKQTKEILAAGGIYTPSDPRYYSGGQFNVDRAKAILSLLNPKAYAKAQELESKGEFISPSVYWQAIEGRQGPSSGAAQKVAEGVRFFGPPVLSQPMAALIAPESANIPTGNPLLELMGARVASGVGRGVLKGVGKLTGKKAVGAGESIAVRLAKTLFGDISEKGAAKVPEGAMTPGRVTVRGVSAAKRKARFKVGQMVARSKTPRLPASTGTASAVNPTVGIEELYPQLFSAQTPVPTLKQTMQRIPENAMNLFNQYFGQSPASKLMTGGPALGRTVKGAVGKAESTLYPGKPPVPMAEWQDVMGRGAATDAAVQVKRALEAIQEQRARLGSRKKK